ncbi:MAG TPA: hypothetical protein DDX98_02385 [Bacteroidales bacterium]|jgi:hypothetical protein|nr:hypothetical protein [Bacteroidales bacterium]
MITWKTVLLVPALFLFVSIICIETSKAQNVNLELKQNNDKTRIKISDNLSVEPQQAFERAVYTHHFLNSIKSEKKSNRQANAIKSLNKESQKKYYLIFAEEIEKEMDIEEWMLIPFTIHSNNSSLFEIEYEEDIDLEPWMNDLSAWEIAVEE